MNSLCDLVILAGGIGSRLHQVIGKKQKVIAKVGGTPFLSLLIRHSYRIGFRRIILALGFHSDAVKNLIENLELPKDLEVVFSVESKPLGTAGAIKLALQHVQSKQVFVQNGDSFCDIDYQAMYCFHQQYSADVTIAVCQVDHRDDAGIVQLDDSCNIITFNEKNSFELGAYESSGIYIMSKDAIDKIPEHIKLSIEEDFFSKKLFQNFKGYVSMSRAVDIGTKERFELAQSQLSIDIVEGVCE